MIDFCRLDQVFAVEAPAMENVADDEQSIKDLIARAKNAPDRTVSLRRDTFQRLLKLTQSPNQQLKILAAKNIRLFFGDFPDLEEEAINAVYDLCEDLSVDVRMEGYSAITQISSESDHLARRNADVLVQLLQSGEPQEVAAVKNALLQHLDINASATLGVLCDQVIPLDESMDPAEQDLRDRLRSLVLNFIIGDAKRAIVERHATPGSETEKVLVEALLEAIERSNIEETEIITEDLLLSLSSFKQPSAYGSSLLKNILNKAIIALRNQKQPTRETSPVLRVLDLASFLVLSKSAASPLELLQFYRRHLCSRFVLQKFNEEDQRTLVFRITEALDATSKFTARDGEDTTFNNLKNQVIDCSSFLLESLGISSMSRTRHVEACIILLTACKERKEATGWTPSDALVNTMKSISDALAAEGAKLPQIQQLIRSLVPATSSIHGKDAAVGSSAPSSTRPQNLAFRPSRATLPKRPSSAMAVDRLPSVTLQPQAMGTRTERHTIIPTEPAFERPPKRPRSDIGIGPSLLNRIGNASSPPIRANEARSTALPQQAADNSLERADVGISIKGAATKREQYSSSRDGGDRRSTQTSLLDRMKDHGTGGNRVFTEHREGGRGRRI